MSLCFMPWTGDSSSSKQHIIGLFSSGRGSIAQPTFGVQEMEFSSRTLHGRHQKGKGVKATDCMGSISWASTALLLCLLPPWGPPRRKEVVWCLATRAQVGVHCFVPHGSPRSCGTTSLSCWRDSEQLQTSNRNRVNVCGQPGKSPEVQPWDWNLRPAHWNKAVWNTGQHSSKNSVFVNCKYIHTAALPMAQQTHRRNQGN